MCSCKPVLFLICALALAACSERLVWTNPDLPKARWSGDRSACGRIADERAGRDLTQAEASGAAMGGGGLSGIASTLAVEDAKRYRRRLYENCMRGRGYRKKRT